MKKKHNKQKTILKLNKIKNKTKPNKITTTKTKSSRELTTHFVSTKTVSHRHLCERVFQLFVPFKPAFHGIARSKDEALRYSVR